MIFLNRSVKHKEKLDHEFERFFFIFKFSIKLTIEKKISYLFNRLNLVFDNEVAFESSFDYSKLVFIDFFHINIYDKIF